MQSIVQQRGAVTFPQFLAERIYMREFTQQEGLPTDLARWQPTVDAMLDGIETDGPIYLMADQSIVRAGTPQRRPGIHIDGYWVASAGRHRHRSIRLGQDSWSDADYKETEGLLLASNVAASRAFDGEFLGKPNEGGDCAHINTGGLREVVLNAGRVYAGNVTMLHESLPVPADFFRTLVRLNVPGWTPT